MHLIENVTIFVMQNRDVMIDKRVIEQVLSEQFEELKKLDKEPLVSRPEEDCIQLDSTMAQVVIGVRRSGKSTLCYSMLKSKGVDFAYANFDDERFLDMTAADLNIVLEVLYKIYGDFNYLFLDEVQNVTGWHLFVNRLLRSRMRVFVTGSNAKLLSGELATHLTGRHDEIELYPFSFRDYCIATGVSIDSPTTKSVAFRRAAFDVYLNQGGFPELLHEKNKTTYISRLVNNILKRDIEQRHRLRYPHAFESLAQHLLNVVPHVVVENDLAHKFGIKSSHTVGKYIDYLKEAYLLVGLKKYSQKSIQRVYEEKVYAVDVAMMDARSDAFAGDNLGWRLETLVYIELLRRNGPKEQDIYYFKNDKGIETDFVVCNGNKALELYQVCYDLSSEKTRAREISSLLTGANATRCNNLYIITDFQSETITQDGKTIQVIPAYEWLLNE